ncbi:MAG: hypothetical protein J7562_19885 [Agrobacterium tumefaciens]|nr:hypothetical protein [Agrobacterium tumefaciens]
MNTNTAAHAITDISMVDDLDPKMIDVVIDGKPEKIMNADFIITLARDNETNGGRALWREYRKMLAYHRNSPGERPGEKLRTAALMDALRKLDHPLAHSPQVRFW